MTRAQLCQQQRVHSGILAQLTAVVHMVLLEDLRVNLLIASGDCWNDVGFLNLWLFTA